MSNKIHKPKIYKYAISDPIYSWQWKNVIEKELHNFKLHYTWEFEELPQGQKIIGSKWVFKIKYKINGTIAQFKAWLMAQSFFQVLGIKFTKRFALIVKKKLLQIYLIIYILFRFIIYQVNIIGVYLKTLLDNNKYPDIYEITSKHWANETRIIL